jgi:single-strand DNA-binding protein
MNSIVISGNLGADPERRSYTDKNNVEQPIAVFRVAANRRFKREGQPDADWFNVKVFGPQAQSCLDHLSKGRTVVVRGSLEFSQVPHKEYADVTMTYADLTAEQVDFVGPRPEGQASASNGNGAPAEAPAPASSGSKLPF